MRVWSALLALAVPGWMEYWGALVGLIVGTAAAGALIHRGYLAVRRGWKALVKPWTLVNQIEDLIEEQETDGCKPTTPPAK